MHAVGAGQTIPQGASTDASKLARELYIGNLPAGVQASQVQEFLGAAMTQLGFCRQPGNPIANAWLSSDNNYAFAEFRTSKPRSCCLL